MKKLLFLFVVAFFALAASAQDEMPTVNWPYLYPDFVQGELMQIGGGTSKGQYNIHLGQGALHLVENGQIGEISVQTVMKVTMGEDIFRNVGGRMYKVLAEGKEGYVVMETLADYSAIVRNDGAYGGSLSNAAKGFSYDENYGNYSYLVTNNYADLLSIKNESEELPVTKNTYLVIDNQLHQANKKSVLAIEGVDKKAFAEFLKSNDIKWKNTEDLVKVIDYITASK